MQGLLLLSPSIDVPRTLFLRVMSMVQDVILVVAPAWRVVPAPKLDDVTNDAAVVSLQAKAVAQQVALQRSALLRIVSQHKPNST